MLYVPSRTGAIHVQLVPGDPERSDFRYMRGRAQSAAGEELIPRLKPPYSRLTAIDMNTGEHLWWIPVGDTPNIVLNNPALREIEIPNTGTGRQAAQVVTKTLLIHTGNGSDGTPYLYAVNKATGERLAQVKLPGNPRYGLSTFMHEDEQYIVVQIPNMLAALKLP